MSKNLMPQILGGLLIFSLVVSIASVVQAKPQSRGYQAVTLCHATHSASNPYVQIIIDDQGLNGHRHHSGDIIPAPAGGCPGGIIPTPTPTPTPTCCIQPTVTPQVLGTTAPTSGISIGGASVTALPTTGSNFSWIYYLVVMGTIISAYYLKVCGWKKITVR